MLWKLRQRVKDKMGCFELKKYLIVFSNGRALQEQ